MNIPNILTVIRLLLIPVFISIFFSSMDNNILYATYVFALAGITDVLDGYIARKYNLVTKWGTVLDPLADKLMQITVLICFTIAKYLSVWVIVVIGIKELLMITGGLFLFYGKDKTVIPANKFGKIATISFYIAILAFAFELNHIVSYSLIIITIVLTLSAFVNYLIGFKNVSMGNNNKCVDK
ncbi:CDP-diacylglycerol--glycerol-3-phosphate 3-phosphatidyltransferase [Sporosalibacterium faouarense]|uniref:CDP-diacylglycerol--glycerol-3-phosphate 3-phosphatidyltransferase n=1 Tax=Sporosalibacterium faouarense TaxID=516123 RepID=UPI00141D2E05|nr:CDP-diacylglycerol--glycerol-3-phosphate 3-phosphatidyltransferase [Sporosalibacterium faouarense]MTI49557.1 CDP-diacylglycerol--glycerol-3-phosphate 3-phosphatidyltransferase [Bacillota bacterium]